MAEVSPELEGCSILYQLMRFGNFIFHLSGIIVAGRGSVIMIIEAPCVSARSGAPILCML